MHLLTSLNSTRPIGHAGLILALVEMFGCDGYWQASNGLLFHIYKDTPECLRSYGVFTPRYFGQMSPHLQKRTGSNSIGATARSGEE